MYRVPIKISVLLVVAPSYWLDRTAGGRADSLFRAGGQLLYDCHPQIPSADRLKYLEFKKNIIGASA